MTDLRREFELRIDAAEEALEDARRALRWLDGRPPGCKCDPRDWGGIPGPVCDRFESDADQRIADHCRHCEHPEDCHEVPR